MEKLTNGRTFDYDIESLLGYVAPPIAGQVIMLISGLPGTGGVGTWCGKTNGTHGLVGQEPVADAYQHWWSYFTVTGYSSVYFYRYTMPSFLWLRAGVPPASSVSEWRIKYGTGFTFVPYSQTQTASPTIQDKLFKSNIIVNGVTFTWSRGDDWSRGNM